jgi:hypothetical protein
MDKRLTFLNRLKKRLNSYIVSGSQKNNSLHQKKQTPITNYSQLRAQMLCENVQSGMALDIITFNTSSVYVEFSKGGTFNFHIYPIINEVSESLTKNSDKDRETEEQKLNYLTVKKSM